MLASLSVSPQKNHPTFDGDIKLTQNRFLKLLNRSDDCFSVKVTGIRSTSKQLKSQALENLVPHLMLYLRSMIQNQIYLFSIRFFEIEKLLPTASQSLISIQLVPIEQTDQTEIQVYFQGDLVHQQQTTNGTKPVRL